QTAFAEDLLRTNNPHPGPDLEAGRQLAILGGHATGLTLDLVQQVFKHGAVPFEAIGVHVCEVIRNGLELGILGAQTGLAYPKCTVHVNLSSWKCSLLSNNWPNKRTQINGQEYELGSFPGGGLTSRPMKPAKICR